jgi:hypothetical protein
MTMSRMHVPRRFTRMKLQAICCTRQQIVHCRAHAPSCPSASCPPGHCPGRSARLCPPPQRQRQRCHGPSRRADDDPSLANITGFAAPVLSCYDEDDPDTDSDESLSAFRPSESEMLLLCMVLATTRAMRSQEEAAAAASAAAAALPQVVMPASVPLVSPALQGPHPGSQHRQLPLSCPLPLRRRLGSPNLPKPPPAPMSTRLPRSARPTKAGPRRFSPEHQFDREDQTYHTLPLTHSPSTSVPLHPSSPTANALTSQVTTTTG